MQGLHVCRVDGYDQGSNSHDQCSNYQAAQYFEDETKRSIPADFRLFGSEHSQSKNHVDNVDDDNAGVVKDLSGNGKFGVCWVGCPCDACRASEQAYKTEDKGNPCYKELVRSATVLDEDSKM